MFRLIINSGCFELILSYLVDMSELKPVKEYPLVNCEWGRDVSVLMLIHAYVNPREDL